MSHEDEGGATAPPSLACPATPCVSCPYRLDHPSGVWDRTEYERLALWDEDPGPLRVFHCHRENATGRGTVCLGWLYVHIDSVSVRVGLAYGALDLGDVRRVADSAPPVPLHPTGAAAARAGLVDVEAPGPRARRMMASLVRQGAGATDAPRPAERGETATTFVVKGLRTPLDDLRADAAERGVSLSRHLDDLRTPGTIVAAADREETAVDRG